MKVFGWICVVLGVLSFIGAASAGHNVFGPLFWLALGIALVYFGNQKEEERKKNENRKKVESVSKSKHEPKIETTPVSTIASIPIEKSEQVKAKTYWETYKLENSTKAAEIESLGFDFSKSPDKEVKEKILSLETTANDSHCSISELKQKVFKQFEGKIEEGEYLHLMEFYDNKTFAEAKTYNIERTNTIWMIVEGWILQKVHEIEEKYKSLPPRSKKEPTTLLMQFHLEDSNEFSILRKTHIYMKNYPMTQNNKEYVKIIEEIFDRNFDSYIKPFTENEENKKNIKLFNAIISSQIYMACEKIKEEYENLIEECNGHDVSFYAELDIAADRAITKYSIPKG